MRSTYKKEEEAPIATPCESEYVEVDSEAFSGSCVNLNEQFPVLSQNSVICDPKTHKILCYLGVSHRDMMVNFSDDDFKKFTTHRKILERFSDFGLTIYEIKYFDESKLEEFSKHLNLFNDLKKYIAKMIMWIDCDKAKTVKQSVKIFI